MQDKIQEIMGLVNTVQKNRVCAEMCASHKDHYNALASAAWASIESKLRELVREPLSHELAWTIAVVSDSPLDAIRKAERAHNITNTIGEAKE